MAVSVSCYESVLASVALVGEGMLSEMILELVGAGSGSA